MPELDRTVFRIFQKQIAMIVVLAAGAALLFFFTRSMAALNRRASVGIAREWYERAEKALKGGDKEAALAALRRATTNDHDELRYAIALANTLASVGHDEEARESLLRLRERNPESGEINLDLARLAANRKDVDEAAHYYHNALYGMWPTDELAAKRRSVRLEFARFLLNNHRTSDAIPELLLLESEVPDDLASQLQLGRLFLDADEAQHALTRFSEALKIAPQNTTALAGSGESEFRLGNYARAQRYLESAMKSGATESSVQHLLQVADLIVANDPLGARVGANERHRRLRVLIDNAVDRLRTCLGRLTPAIPDGLQALAAEAAETQSELRSVKLKGDPDTIRSVLNLAYRIELVVPRDCGGPSDLDEAIVAIARSHRVTEP